MSRQLWMSPVMAYHDRQTSHRDRQHAVINTSMSPNDVADRSAVVGSGSVLQASAVWPVVVRVAQSGTLPGWSAGAG
jgi:hypothetical protein